MRAASSWHADACCIALVTEFFANRLDCVAFLRHYKTLCTCLCVRKLPGCCRSLSQFIDFSFPSFALRASRRASRFADCTVIKKIKPCFKQCNYEAEQSDRWPLAENIPLVCWKLGLPERAEQFKIFFTVEGDLSPFAREIERRRRLTHRNIYCRDPSREMKKAQRRIASTASDVEFFFERRAKWRT